MHVISADQQQHTTKKRTHAKRVLFFCYLCTQKNNKPNKNKSVMSDNKNKINRDTWGKIIQVAITILTVISGMFFEAKAQAVTSILGI